MTLNIWTREFDQYEQKYRKSFVIQQVERMTSRQNLNVKAKEQFRSYLINLLRWTSSLPSFILSFLLYFLSSFLPFFLEFLPQVTGEGECYYDHKWSWVTFKHSVTFSPSFKCFKMFLTSELPEFSLSITEGIYQ